MTPKDTAPRPALAKAPTGVFGLDEVTRGGLPKGRPTLVCGGPGCGKTMLCIQFLVEGIRQHGENAVFMTFEEESDDLIVNAVSLGFDLADLVEQDRLRIDHIEVGGPVRETGEFDLDGLFIRIRHAVDQVRAKRIAFDTLENLFTGLPNRAVLRAEIHRLFRWLKDHGLTAIVTAEAGEHTLTRDGMEEYVSDCVIALEQNFVDQVATRRLRIVKYRGSTHGTNQYPFVIDEHGFSVVPITGAALRNKASDERISLGTPGMDGLLGGKGIYRGTTVLMTGTAGTGKTTPPRMLPTPPAHAANDAPTTPSSRPPTRSSVTPARWGAALPIGWTKACSGSKAAGRRRRASTGTSPPCAATSGISGHRWWSSIRSQALATSVPTWQTKDMLTLLIDTTAEVDATLVMTSLTEGGAPVVATDVGVSSLADVWVLIEDLQQKGERQRVVSIVKGRGIGHSKHRHHAEIDDQGMRILGPHGASGSAEDTP